MSEREQLLASINANLRGTCVYRTIVRRNGRIDCVYVSPNVEELIGVPAVDFLADSSRFFTVLHPEDVPGFQKSLAEAMAGGGTVDATVRVRHKHGREVWAHFRSQLTEVLPDGAQVRDGVVMDITSIKVAQAELQAVRQRLELALDASRTCIWDDDLAANHIVIDPMWAKMRGYPPQETITTWRRLIAGAHPDDRSAIMRETRRAVGGETDEYRIEQRIATAEGRWIWIMSHGRVVARDEKGRATRMIGTNTDITARKLAEEQVCQMNDNLGRLVAERTAELAARTEELAKSERLFRSLIEDINQGYFVASPRSRFLYCSPAVVAYAGRPAEELLGQSVFRIVAPEDRPRVIATYGEWMRSGESVGKLEFRLADRGDDVVWVEQTSVFVRDAAGTLQEIRSSVRNVTERKLAELARQESEERLAFALEATADGLWDRNLVTDTVYRSPQWARLLGYAPEEVPPTVGFFYDLVHPDERAVVSAKLAAHVSGQTAQISCEVRLRTKSGEYRWFLDRGKVVARDPAGRPLRVVGTITDITERKRSAEAITHTAASLRATLESTADGILTIGRDGKIASFNRPFREMWRIPVEVLDSNDDERALASVLGQLRDPEQFLGKVRYLYDHPDEESIDLLDFKDGRVFERYSRPLLVDGRPAGRVWSFRDITERNRAKQRVAAFARLGRELSATDEVKEAAEVIARIADELFTWDSATFDLYDAATDECQSILNYDLVEGRRQYVPPSRPVAPPTPRMRRAILGGSELILREPPLVPIPGTVVFGDVQRLSASLMIVTMRHGSEIVGVLSIQSYRWHAYTREDLEAMQTLADYCAGALHRIRAARALRASEERLRLVWENASDGMRLADANGIMVAVNGAYCAIVDRPAAELIGRPISESYAAADHERIMRRYRERVAGREGAHQQERSIIRWDGKSLRLEVSNAFIETDPRHPLMLSVFRDVTKRYLEEQEHEKMQARLFQNQKFEALGTLAGGVAHDFNNILTSMMNYTVMAREDCPPSHPGVARFLDEVMKGSQRAKELVRQILLFSRSQETVRKPLELAPIVREALSLLRASLPAAVEIRPELNEICPVVLANSTEVHQVVMNLCINGAQAMGERGGVLDVSVRLRRVDAVLAADLQDIAPGDFICLRIADNGMGMAPAVLAHIYEPFFTTKKVGEGTGLGLAVVRSVVRNHQGAIAVRSRPGEGTTFELYFPVHRVVPATAADLPRAVPAGRGQRILLVDDESMVARSTQMVLERIGYSVEMFLKPTAALERFAAAPQSFDLVIVDFQMPGMNGLELAGQILALRPGIPVLVASGFAPNMTEEKLREQGVRGLLRKPAELSELAGLVARTLQPTP